MALKTLTSDMGDKATPFGEKILTDKKSFLIFSPTSDAKITQFGNRIKDDFDCLIEFFKM
jgi:hypothetical protein